MTPANEAAVDLFRQHLITLPGIWRIVERVMTAHSVVADPTIEDILAADSWARRRAVDSFPGK